MRWLPVLLSLCVAGFAAGGGQEAAVAGEATETTAATAAARKARQNYILNCQGCHLPDGSGAEGAVPRLNGFVGKFLRVPGGREFIVQVPGVAGAPISDAELAAVMNWLLAAFSNAELPPDFRPYTAAEVGDLRRSPLVDVKRARARLVKKMEKL